MHVADDLDDAIYGRGPIPFRRNGATEPPPLWIETGGWVEADLPRRAWLAPGYLLRGHVTVLAGPPSAGKSQLCLGYAINLCFGTAWGRFVPCAPCKVSILNAEDDANEQKLRLSAALRTAGRVPAEVAGRIARIGMTHPTPLVDFDPATGRASPTAAMGLVCDHLREFQPDVLMVDPLVELHNAGENDNQALRAVIAVFRDIARAHNCALLIVHHSRKGSGADAGDPDMMRGAGAIVGAARVALTCCVMTEEEAAELGIPPEGRGAYFRVDGAKSNYARLREAEWYERIEHLLDNGELVPCALPWEPPKRTADATDLDRLVDAIGRALPPYSPRLGREDRSVAHLLASHGYPGKAAQEAVLVALFRDRGVTRSRFQRPGRSATADCAIGLKTANGLPAGVPWLD